MTPSIPDAIRTKFANGADEILVRVSSYGPDRITPSQYQAIVRYRDRTEVWGVGVHADSETALLKALDMSVEETTGLNDFDPLEDL